MTNTIFIIFPIHLFKNIKELKNHKNVLLIEEPRYFTDFNFHKLKLAYHRATMKKYEDYLINNDIKVSYKNFDTIDKTFYKKLSQQYDEIYYYNPTDYELEEKLKFKNFIQLPSQNFLITKELTDENKILFYNNQKYNFMNFYKWQRKRLNILIKKDEKPVGDKWTFDKENRKALPKGIELSSPKTLNNEYIEEAIKYVNKHFKDNYGSLEHFIYPISHDQAKKWLINFLDKKFKNFGKYEDAIDKDNNFVFHSILSPMMNIGLLTDNEVIEETLKYEKNTPVEAFEGFIRQIIGWRNYVLMMYFYEHTKMEKNNFLKAKMALPFQKFWEGTTGIEPVDNAIHEIEKYAYTHHIIRLMVLGNFMLLLGIKPKDVYTIFMEWAIDAYAWVMYANVYGMSQHSSGNIMMTRPYFSSSNYILRMSNYKKNEDWCVIFDCLYYYFINKHQKYLKTNYSTIQMVNAWNRKENKKEILNIANQYIKKLNS